MHTGILFLTAASDYAAMKPALIALYAILGFLAVLSVVFTLLFLIKKPRSVVLLGSLYIATALTLVCALLCTVRYVQFGAALDEYNAYLSSLNTPPVMKPEPTEDPTEPPTELPTEPPTVPEPTFDPEYVEDTDPANWNLSFQMKVGNEITNEYQREESISFGKGSEYFALPGVATFRGNNYRDGATYGTATVENETISRVWTAYVGSLNGWPGVGWTGQPLVVKWDQETKNIMNLYEDKKNKEGLVEVIAATLDGYIYFLDLEDGTPTRDRMFVGMNFKGAGALDPRGYPIMYVGSGDDYNGKLPRMYIINLIDCSVMYTNGNGDSFAQRYWFGFDSSPLVDAETDTLIWPGESGVLYTIKLNTEYDKEAGTLTINPEETVKSRYSSKKSTSGASWVGYEPSASIVGRYLYIAENGGLFFCIDLDTMQAVWTQDILDDTNSSPVFEWDEDGNGYIYIAPSLRWTANNNSRGDIYVYKLNAKTGEIIWKQPFYCFSDRVADVSGGVQSTALLGKEGTDLDGLVIYTICRTPNLNDGKVVAFDKVTGDIVWELPMQYYTWSSPAAYYTEDGRGYIVVCDSAGNCMLIDASGTVLHTIGLGSNVEASPVVYENMLVVGTRGSLICGIKIE